MIRMIVWTATVLVIVVFFAGCTQQEKQPGSSAQQKQWNQAEMDAKANAPLAKEPEINADTYFTTGLLHEKQGNLTNAIANYQKALDLKPDYPNATNRLGEIFMRLHEYDQAETTYSRALKFQPDSPSLLNNLAYTHIALHRYADAETELNRAVRLDPQFTRARINLGLALAKQGKYDEAMKSFRLACPEDEANYNLGMILHSEGKVELAKKYYRTALAFNPAFEPAKKGLQQLATMPAIVKRPTSLPATRPAK